VQYYFSNRLAKEVSKPDKQTTNEVIGFGEDGGAVTRSGPMSYEWSKEYAKGGPNWMY
jgi:hypothetical protein